MSFETGKEAEGTEIDKIHSQITTYSTLNPLPIISDFFAGKVVIVTGSSNGIGREAARQYAARGARVTITGRNPDTLKVTKQMCLDAGAKPTDVVEVLGDISAEETVHKIINASVEAFGQIDVLVNNAGMVFVDASGGKGFEQPLEIFDKTLAVNTRSVIALTQLSTPYLEKTKGAVVNISSISGQPFYSPGGAFYNIAKAALDQLTVQMAGHLIKKGVRVNSISPGAVRTDFGTKMGIPSEAIDRLLNVYSEDRMMIPLGRVGTPDDIAKLILFLSDRTQSEFIVGQRIIADGGSMLHNNCLSTDFFDKLQ